MMVVSTRKSRARHRPVDDDTRSDTEALDSDDFYRKFIVCLELR